MICYKCWSDAYERSLWNGMHQHDNYIQLLNERADNPCTLEEQLGRKPTDEERKEEK